MECSSIKIMLLFTTQWHFQHIHQKTFTEFDTTNLTWSLSTFSNYDTYKLLKSALDTYSSSSTTQIISNKTTTEPNHVNSDFIARPHMKASNNTFSNSREMAKNILVIQREIGSGSQASTASNHAGNLDKYALQAFKKLPTK